MAVTCQYKMLSSTNGCTALQTQVDDLLSRGWKLWGSPFATASSGCETLYQAMTYGIPGAVE